MKVRNLEGHYAGFMSRAAGLILDYVLVLALTALFVAATIVLFRTLGADLLACRAAAPTTNFGLLLCAGGGLVVLLEAMLTAPLYYVLCWGLIGQTVGQRVMGVRVIKMDGRQIGFGRSFVRFLACQLCLLTLGIGFLWVLVDDRRMGWHDKIARTYVIYSWKAVQNEGFIAKVNRRFGRASKGESRTSKTAS